MICPKCNGRESKCIDTRQYDDGIRRRRECLVCGTRFSTVEVGVDHYRNLEANSLRGSMLINELARKERFLAEIFKCVDGISKKLNKREGFN